MWTYVGVCGAVCMKQAWSVCGCMWVYVGVCGVTCVNQTTCQVGWFTDRMWEYVGRMWMYVGVYV